MLQMSFDCYVFKFLQRSCGRKTFDDVFVFIFLVRSMAGTLVLVSEVSGT